MAIKKLGVIIIILTFVAESYAQSKGSGYRGFFEIDYTIGINGWEKKIPALQTSHGYQFNPWLYTGLGMALDWVTNSSRHDSSMANFFVDIRSDLIRRKVCPFVDLKVGYTLLGADGLYVNPNIGCRITLTHRNGVNISAGYVSRCHSVANIGTNGYHYYSSKRSDAIMVTVGIDI